MSSKKMKKVVRLFVDRNPDVVSLHRKKKTNVYGYQTAQVLWGRRNHEECDGGVSGWGGNAEDGVRGEGGGVAVEVDGYDS